jgi:uncharacterized membrane protein YdjX (TVP38/TMEM64 family)
VTTTADVEVARLSARAARLRLILLALAVAGMAAIAIGVGPDVATIRGWVAQLGWIAPLAFALLYAVLTVALVPGSVLTLAAGLLFGAVLGSGLTVVGATLGATIAFVIARTTGRRAVERLVSGRAARVDAWLRDRGLVAVITLRLVPLVPFSAANYAAGITAIRPRHFMVGTAIGIVPGTIAYTVLGARFTDPTDPLFVGAMVGLALLAVGGSALLRRSRRTDSDRPRAGEDRRNDEAAATRT